MKIISLLLLLLPISSFAQAIYFEPIEAEMAKSGIYRSIFEDSTGHIWFGTMNEGVIRKVGDVFEKLIPPDTINLKGAASIFESKDGSIYFTGRGVFKIKDGIISKIDDAGVKSSVVFNITEDENGIWFLGNRGAAYLTDQGIWSGYFSGSGLTDLVAHDGEFDDEGNHWIATRRGGLNIIDNEGEWSNPFPNANCRKILKSSNGDMWIGSNKGILHYESGTRILTVYREDELLIPEFEAEDGSIWFSSESSGLWRFIDESFQQMWTQPVYTAQNLSTGEILIGATTGLDTL